MEFTGYYEFLINKIEEASAELGGSLAPNEEKLALIKPIGEQIEAIARGELECESIDAAADKNARRLTIRVVCDEAVFYPGRMNGFFRLVSMIDSFSFSKIGEESIAIDLNIDNMWK